MKRTTKKFEVDGKIVELQGITIEEWNEKLDDGASEERLKEKYYVKVPKNSNVPFLNDEDRKVYDKAARLLASHTWTSETPDGIKLGVKLYVHKDIKK